MRLIYTVEHMCVVQLVYTLMLVVQVYVLKYMYYSSIFTKQIVLIRVHST